MGKKSKAINFIALFLVILSIWMFSGCSNKDAAANKENTITQGKNTLSRITPAEAKERMDNEKGIVILDVRTQEEYNTGHIKDSILIPVDVLEQKAEENLKDKNVPIFVYCRSGNRSATAANILVKLGYKNVYDLGGIRNWPYEVVK